MLLDDMAQTMQEANGAGLAAVQVGVLRRVVVIDIGDESGLVELVNPAVTWESPEKITTSEACLSFPGEAGVVTRPRRVTVTAQDRHGNLFTVDGEELKARALCHEIDHLDGVLFIDHIKDQKDAFYQLNDKGDLEALPYDQLDLKALYPDE